LFGLGLNKPRSRFGSFLDRKGISQLEFAERSGLSRNTVSKLCNYDDEGVYEETLLKAVSALRKMGFNVSISDFW
jgi:transcriptional regulator with XRE-family HTH domain